MSMLVSAIVLFPFFLIFVIGIPSLNLSQILLRPAVPFLSVEWGLFINIIAFKFTGFDTISHFAGEMKNPGSFFRAMGGALLLAIGSRILPMLVAVCVDKNYSQYNEGYYTVIADEVGGKFLSSLVVISATIGCFVTYVTYLYASAVTLFTLAAKEYLDAPRLYVMNRFDTPWLSIVVVASTSFLFGILSFEELVKLSGSLYQICLLMQYAALVKLRITKPKLERPNKIPLSTNGLILFLIPPSAIAIFILFSAVSHSLSAACVLIGSVVSSVTLYYVKGWFFGPPRFFPSKRSI